MDKDVHHEKQLEKIEIHQRSSLRFMDQTRNPSTRRPGNKRTRSGISPPLEGVIEAIVTSRIKKIVGSTANELVPKKIENLKSTPEELKKPLIHEKLETYKNRS